VAATKWIGKEAREMDRRSFIATGVWISGGVLTPAWLIQATQAAEAAQAGSGQHALAIFDASLTEAAAFAGHTARLGISALDIGDDIGALWHATLAPRAASEPVTILGVVRAADYFVLSRLAQRPGDALPHGLLPLDASRLPRSSAVSFVMSL
jgi:hypothetical protein